MKFEFYTFHWTGSTIVTKHSSSFAKTIKCSKAGGTILFSIDDKMYYSTNPNISQVAKVVNTILRSY